MELKHNDFVIVEGRSAKGKNRVREHGNKWRIENGDGEMLLITPFNATDLKQLRWIHATNDPHFKIVG